MKSTISEKQVSRTRVEIVKEAKRIEESSLHSAKGHFEAARIWGNFHLMIGLPVVIMSAVAGASAFSEIPHSKVIAGILSMIIAALTSLMTFLNPNGKASSHLSSGNNFDSLQNRVRIFWSVDCAKEESEEVLTEKLKYFSDQKDKLNSNSPQIPWIAYKSAKKGIENGEGEYKVDKNTTV